MYGNRKIDFDARRKSLTVGNDGPGEAQIPGQAGLECVDNMAARGGGVPGHVNFLMQINLENRRKTLKFIPE